MSKALRECEQASFYRHLVRVIAVRLFMAQEDLGSWKSHQTINLTQAIYYGETQPGSYL